MNTTFQISAKLSTETCCSCFIQFAMPEELQTKRRNDGGSFYCPNGHSQHYTKTRVQELEEQLNRERAAKERAENEKRAAVNREESEREQRMAAEAARDRLKRRIKAGSCPCCKRNFSNLRRHMETKHPGFAPK
jgi:hypothetical protein